MFGDISGLSQGAIGISWLEPRDATKFLNAQDSPPTTKNYRIHNVNSAEDEKPCFKEKGSLALQINMHRS